MRRHQSALLTAEALQEPGMLWEGGGGMSGCFPAAVVGLGVETTGAEPGGLFGNQIPACHPSPLPYFKVYQSCTSAHREPEASESSEACPSTCP